MGANIVYTLEGNAAWGYHIAFPFEQYERQLRKSLYGDTSRRTTVWDAWSDNDQILSGLASVLREAK